MSPTLTTDPPTRPWHRLASTDPKDVVPRLLALLVVPTDGGAPTVIGLIVAVAVIATPRLLHSPTLWTAMGAIRLSDQLLDWHGVDDHEILISYACLAFGLALWTSDPARTARTSLPVLVGLAMAFATAWKLGSGQFADGDTMRYTLLTDPRFDLAGAWLGGLGEAARSANDTAVATLRDPELGRVVTLVEPGRATAFALALTLGAIVIEGMLAVLFLRPRSHATARASVLAIFCVATYLIVPVTRFGLVLCAGAYAGSESRVDRRILLLTVAFCAFWPPVWVALGGTQ